MRPTTTALLPLTACLFAACGGGGGGGGEPPPPPNDPPSITAPSGLGGSGGIRSLTLATGDTQTLRFTATDPDGDTLQWLAQTSSGSATAAGLTFTSPQAGAEFTIDLTAVGAPTAATLTLLVEDPRGNAAGLDLRVVRSGAPTITGVAPDSAFAGQPQAVTITGTALSLGGAVTTSASFDGLLAGSITVVDDQTLRCTTPVALAAGPTVTSISHAFGTAQLPDTAFTAFAFPPMLAANDAALDAGNATAPHVARDGDAVHAVWLEGNDVVHRVSTNGGASWSAPQTLSGGEVATEPRVVVTGSDVVCAWIGGGNSVVARTSHDGGASFAAAQTLDSGSTVQRPRLAASGARRYVAWLRGSTGLGTSRVTATRSADGGDTWAAAALIGDGGANQHSHELACSGAIAWAAFVDERDGVSVAGVYTARTTTGGSLWESAQRRSLTGTAANSPRLCHGAGKVWLAWLRADALEYVGSADAGLSWPTVPFDLRSGSGAVAQPAVCCEGDRFYAVYLLDGTSVAVTRVGGIGTAPQHTTVSAVTGPAGEPAIATRGNYVVAAWRNGAVAGGGARIVTATSADLGATFSAPLGFGDGSASQEMPQLQFDGARLALVWIDHRTTPAGVFTNRTFQ